MCLIDTQEQTLLELYSGFSPVAFALACAFWLSEGCNTQCDLQVFKDS